MSKLTNITAPEHRCTYGHCPAIYKFDGDKSYGIIGKVVNDPDLADRIGEGEAAVEISADLLLASFGLPALIEAAEQAEKELLWASDQSDEFKPLVLAARALRSALNAIKTGTNG